jgi:hypothetical protein
MANCNLLNTHYYDNKIDISLEIVEKLQECSLTEKKDIVSLFVSDILLMDVPDKDNASVHFLNIMMNEWGLPSNFDNTNNIHAENMLYICALEWNNIRLLPIDQMVIISTDFSKLFFTQLSDIQSGPCAQGRATRLWQIAKAYLELIYLVD